MNVECWEVDGNNKMEELSHIVEMSTFRGAPIKVIMSVCLFIGLSVCLFVCLSVCLSVFIFSGYMINSKSSNVFATR